jgi:hypothetical protein
MKVPEIASKEVGPMKVPEIASSGAPASSGTTRGNSTKASPPASWRLTKCRKR